MNNSSAERGMEQMKVTEVQKIELFGEAMRLLEDRFMYLAGVSPANRAAMKYNMETNIGMLIEELCSNNPMGGVGECKDVFEELNRILGDQDLSVLHFSDKDKLRGKFVHAIKIKLSPLLAAKLESMNEVENAKQVRTWFAQDQKRFLQTGMSALLGIPDQVVPKWYTDLAKRRQYEQLQVDALSDPEAAKILRNIQSQAMHKLRGQ